MSNTTIHYTDQVYDKLDLPQLGSRETHFDNCIFRNNDFTDADFYGCDFVNCTFDACNLSMVKFVKNGFDKVQFTNCKMVGVDFSNAKDFLFGVDFDNCILDYAAFMKKKNKKAKFVACSLKGTDFSEADLSMSVFTKCDLNTAVFMSTVLTGVNFSTAYNYTIDPERNQIRKAKFAVNGLPGLLANYGIIVEEN